MSVALAGCDAVPAVAAGASLATVLVSCSGVYGRELPE